MIIKIEVASKILSEYGLKLLPAWDGFRNMWHVWHPGLIYRITFDEYVDRVIEIYRFKPKCQHSQRLIAMRPVVHAFSSETYAELNCADTEWKRTEVELHRIYSEWKRAQAEWNRADAEWKRADANEINLAHSEECSCCGWNGKEMIFN